MDRKAPTPLVISGNIDVTEVGFMILYESTRLWPIVIGCISHRKFLYHPKTQVATAQEDEMSKVSVLIDEDNRISPPLYLDGRIMNRLATVSQSW
jgi:hypothetical protein